MCLCSCSLLCLYVHRHAVVHLLTIAPVHCYVCLLLFTIVPSCLFTVVPVCVHPPFSLFAASQCSTGTDNICLMLSG